MRELADSITTAYYNSRNLSTLSLSKTSLERVLLVDMRVSVKLKRLITRMLVFYPIEVQCMRAEYFKIRVAEA